MTVGGGLSQGRIIAAQAGVLFLLLRSSFALIVEELAITAGADGGHWMPPNPVGSCPPIIIIPNFSSRGLSYRKTNAVSSLVPGELPLS
jgi:hypothetical protein